MADLEGTKELISPIRIGYKDGDRKGAPEKGEVLTKYDSQFLRLYS